jgi:uncharacterized protein (TIGR00661 family)
LVGDWILKNYAPTSHSVGFHFSSFDNDIFTPVIRQRVRDASVSDRGHYTVYLPAYDDKKLVSLLLEIPYTRWHIFSKHAKKPYHVSKVSVYPVNNEDFTGSMASAKGVLCGAGFETPAEALYLGKKLLVVPMKNQYEQHFNAAALKQIGVPVVKKMKKKNIDKIFDWVNNAQTVSQTYGNVAQAAVARAMELHQQL